MMHWKITPHHSGDADHCLIGGKTDGDHHAALEYAKSRLQAAWELLRPGETATVTISLLEGDAPEASDADI